MEIQVFDLPHLNLDNADRVATVAYDLGRRYRDGKTLDQVELTWLDQANNWLDFYLSE